MLFFFAHHIHIEHYTSAETQHPYYESLWRLHHADASLQQSLKGWKGQINSAKLKRTTAFFPTALNIHRNQ